MKECSPLYDHDEQFADYHNSPFLTFGSDIKINDDPGTEEEFDTALCYLEVIMDEFIQSGQLWQKTAADVLDRLLYLNERHKYEVEQEHRTGETSTTYIAVAIQQLRALSQRQVSAMAEMGMMETETYRIASFFHSLVEHAAAFAEVDETLNLIVPTVYLTGETEQDTGVPF
ncbi:MAG: hypothetical protein R2932_28810 [Caldilineaceae bacterium]